MEDIIASKKKTTLTPEQLREKVVKILDDNKAEDIVDIDLAGKTSIADFMVICTGRSSRAVVALAENLAQDMAEYGYKPRVEGKETGDWVLVDAGDFIVHVFRPEVREFYQLEKMWAVDFNAPDHTLYISA